MTGANTSGWMARHASGSEERWRDSLAHSTDILHLIRSRPPLAHDGTDLLKAELRQAQASARVPGAATELYNAIARGAGAAEACILIQRRWRAYDEAGAVLLAEPGTPPRRLPIGDTGVAYPEWIKGFALAAISRDADALSILCAPDSIIACELPATMIDAFWPFYCGALASLVIDPAQVPTWIADTETALGAAQIAEPALIELLVRPTLALIARLAAGDTAAFQNALAAALDAHQRYYTQPDRLYDENGAIAIEATALAALAADRSVPLAALSDYTPAALVQGDFPRQLALVTYCYPERGIADAREAHWFLDYVGFPRAGRSHLIVEREGRLIARYNAHGAPSLPHAEADFVLADGPGLPPTIPPALDAGALLALAERYARAAGELGRDPPEQQALLADAVACVETILARIPPDRDAVDPATITDPTGIAIYQAEPGRFRRDRLVAYHDRLADTSDARATALLSIELIRAQVEPLLAALARDTSGSLARQLMPRDDDYGQVFLGAAVAAARRAYSVIWDQGIQPAHPPADRFEIRCFVAPAGMLSNENELSYNFPSGYRAIAAWLNPQRAWVAWKLLLPGQSAGLSLDGLVWVDDHWAWFPKPYRALRELVT